jgi:RTX calcium-binding nonapeptide repeat (4 copies)
MSLRAGVPAVAAVVLGCLPSPAAAGTAVLESKPGPRGPAYELTYRAAPRERNDLTVSAGDYFVRVEDTAGLSTGSGCDLQADSGGTVAICPVSRGNAPARLNLGDRDDRARVVTWPYQDVVINGGGGDDELSSAGPAYNFFSGGRGDDVMTGGGDGTLFDEGRRRNGSDTMSAVAQPAANGWSNAWVDYAGRRRPIRANLIRGLNAGEGGERDRLGAGITSIWGGAAADRLLGDGLANQLVGGPGADVLAGRAGDDSLIATSFPRSPDLSSPERVIAGRGADRLFGGPGADFVEGSATANLLSGGRGPDRVVAARGRDRVVDRDGYTDEILCGDGRDRVREDAVDLIRGCERSVSRSRAAVPIRAEGEEYLCGRPTDPPCPQLWAVIDIGCRGTAPPSGTCRGSVRLELDGQPIGAESFSDGNPLVPGFAEVSLPLTEETFTLFENRDPRVTVVVVSKSGGSRRAVSVDIRRLADGYGGWDFPNPLS